MKKIIRITLSYAGLCAVFFPVHAELARIGMVHFTGNVESAGYLGGSLSSAIDDSLKSKFSYEPIAADKVQQILTQLSETGVFDPQTIPEKNNLLRIAVALDADILIYGSYGILGKPGQSAETTQISMKTYVYYVNENRVAELPELKPRLDMSLFEAINTSAENVVHELKKITVETDADHRHGSIQTEATLRTAWIPLSGNDARNYRALVLYKKLTENMRESNDGVQIAQRSVDAYARRAHSATVSSHDFLSGAAQAFKADIVFSPSIEIENKRKYLSIAAFHAQLNRVLFTIKEELNAQRDETAAKLQNDILKQLRGLEFSVTARFAGLKGEGLTLNFNDTNLSGEANETGKNFGTHFMTDASYSLSVKTHPKEPRQFCHVRNGKGKVTFKNVEILVTCITETLPVVVKTTEFYGDEFVVDLDGKESLKVIGYGEKAFQTRFEDMHPFTVEIKRQPQNPPQRCKVSSPSRVRDGDTAITIRASCRKAIEHFGAVLLGYPAMGSLGTSATSLQVNENFPVGQMSSAFAVSAVYQLANFLPYGLLLGGQLNFSTASASLPVQEFSGGTSSDTIKTNMLRTDLVAFTAYPIVLPFRFELLPYAGFGMSYQNLWRSGGANLNAGLSPVLSLGTMLQYDYTRRIKLLFKTGPDLYFYSGGENLMIWSFNVGVGMQFL